MIFTPHRSWQNFWIAVGAAIVFTAIIAIFKPERLWTAGVVDAVVVVVLLLDSYLAGRRGGR